jgi:hypothetical protein
MKKLRTLSLIGLATVLLVAGAPVAARGASAGADNPVLPRTARPEGWSIRQMAAAVATFDASGNNPADYPHTPFQILYYDPATNQCPVVNGGLDCTGSNSFTVPAGKYLYVPFFNVDDSPPIIGTYPATHELAVGYFFDPAQVGGRDFSIIVDGEQVAIGWPYLAGPVPTKPLPDGGGTHMIVLGAFLRLLGPGEHTVTITGGVFGQAVQAATGLTFVREHETYRVTVG